MYKFYIWLVANFIHDKRLRHRFRRLQWMKHCVKEVAKQKWGVSYSVFDGIDLLENSIKSIRNQVDYVQVIYQNISWRGIKSEIELLPVLQKMQSQGLIDEIVFFEPNLQLKPWKNETIKRNLGLNIAKKRGVTYFMPMDVDEFYFNDELEYAKLQIINKQITHAFCIQEVYGVLPTHKLSHVDNKRSFVNIFSKIYWFSKLCGNEHAPCLADPTRKLSHYPWAKYYVLDSIAMQHMTVLRKDVNIKFACSSNKLLNKKQYLNKSYVEVDDYFNLMPIVEKWRNQK